MWFVVIFCLLVTICSSHEHNDGCETSLEAGPSLSLDDSESTRRRLYGIYIPEPNKYFKYIANEVLYSNWVVNYGVNIPNQQGFVQVGDGWSYLGTGVGLKYGEAEVYTGWGRTMFSFSGDKTDQEYGISLIVGNYGVRVDHDFDNLQTAVEVIAGSTEIGILSDRQDQEYGFRLRYRDFEFSIRHDFYDVGDAAVGDNLELVTELYVGYKSLGVAIGYDVRDQEYGVGISYKGRDVTIVRDFDEKQTDVSVKFSNGWSMIMSGDFADPLSNEVYGRFGIGNSNLFVSAGAGVSTKGLPQASFSVVAKSWNVALDIIDDGGTDLFWFSVGVGKFSYVWETTVDWNYAIVDLPGFSNIDTNKVDESKVPGWKKRRLRVKGGYDPVVVSQPSASENRGRSDDKFLGNQRPSNRRLLERMTSLSRKATSYSRNSEKDKKIMELCLYCSSNNENSSFIPDGNNQTGTFLDPKTNAEMKSKRTSSFFSTSAVPSPKISSSLNHGKITIDDILSGRPSLKFINQQTKNLNEQTTTAPSTNNDTINAIDKHDYSQTVNKLENNPTNIELDRLFKARDSSQPQKNNNNSQNNSESKRTQTFMSQFKNISTSYTDKYETKLNNLESYGTTFSHQNSVKVSKTNNKEQDDNRRRLHEKEQSSSSESPQSETETRRQSFQCSNQEEGSPVSTQNSEKILKTSASFSATTTGCSGWGRPSVARPSANRRSFLPLSHSRKLSQISLDEHRQQMRRL